MSDNEDIISDTIETEYQDIEDIEDIDDIDDIDDVDDIDDINDIDDVDDINDDKLYNNIFNIDNENENNIYIVNPNNRKTSEKLTIFEVTEIINIRAENISQGGVIFTDVNQLNNPIDMAIKELKDKKCPLYVNRSIGNNKIERWSPNEMIFDI